MNKKELTDLQIKHRRQQLEIQEEIKNHKQQIHRYIVRGKMMESEMPEIKNMCDDAFCELIHDLKTVFYTV